MPDEFTHVSGEGGSGMHDVTLAQVALFLAAAVIAAPLAKLLRIGTVLGYLLVGVLIGPSVLGLVADVGSVLHFAEFGVIMLLFVIGLELRPRRLWAMRSAIFGLGSVQVAVTGVVLAAAAMAFGLAWQAALFAGLALSLSSTAFALQVLFSRWWLSRYAFGPLEWIWRGLTYRAWPPLRRAARAAVA